MLRDWELETKKRVEWIKDVLCRTGQKGVVFANSGGKDAALTGILCRRATPNILSIILPCESKRNYGEDRDHALLLAAEFDIPTIEVDLTESKTALTRAICAASDDIILPSLYNINPRLRMITLYAYSQSLSYLVAGTGNLSEYTMGYFTKWGDGAYDFNPIADLTASEIFEYLTYLGAPREIIEKAPSAGLYDGQTDEDEMGLTYAELDAYIRRGEGSAETIAKIERASQNTAHKRMPHIRYPD